MSTKSNSRNESATLMQDEGDERRRYIANLVHEKYLNPTFSIYKFVPDISSEELDFFNEQYRMMIKDYRSE